MVSIPKIVGMGMMACGVLCLSLANATHAGDTANIPSANMKSDPCSEKPTGQDNQENKIGQPQGSTMNCNRSTEGGETVKGELLRISGDNYVVQRFDGREVRLHTDANTEMTKGLHQGDRIEAQVDDVRDRDDHKRVLSIHQVE